MKLVSVEDAISEARRFIIRAIVVKKLYTGQNDIDYLWGNKETAALRRSSMDLTRVLAKLRKP